MALKNSEEYSFRTKASPGQEFSFVVQADPHFDPRVIGLSREEYSSMTDPKADHDPEIWIAGSENIVDFYPYTDTTEKTGGYGDEIPDYYTNNSPDFLIDLGDTFMVEKIIGNGYYDDNDIDGTNQLFDYNDVDFCYRYIRNTFFSPLSHSIPLFLATGNHEGEMGKLWNSDDEDKQNLALWSIQSRRKYFLNPVPDGTNYTGSITTEAFDSARRDTWFSWKWGNAQFIVLDPFWYSTGNFTTEGGWAFTLGEEQYHWLSNLLSQTDESILYKFVFIHHLVGGAQSLSGPGRGGIETVPWFEWGGLEPNDESDPTDDEYLFGTKRSTWSTPIHDLLVQGKVTAVFHGHDHVFVHQYLDGIHYVELGQISSPNYNSESLAENHGYVTGDVLSSSGYMRIKVNSSEATFQYIKVYHPDDEGQQEGEADPYGYTGDVAYQWEYVPEDTTPDQFTFTDQIDVEPDTVITSNTITISGINATASVSITGGTYSIDGGTYTSADGTVDNGDTVTVQHTSSVSGSTTTNTTLIIGGISDTFSVTTQAVNSGDDDGGGGGGCFIDTIVIGSQQFK